MPWAVSKRRAYSKVQSPMRLVPSGYGLYAGRRFAAWQSSGILHHGIARWQFWMRSPQAALILGISSFTKQQYWRDEWRTTASQFAALSRLTVGGWAYTATNQWHRSTCGPLRHRYRISRESAHFDAGAGGIGRAGLMGWHVVFTVDMAAEDITVVCVSMEHQYRCQAFNGCARRAARQPVKTAAVSVAPVCRVAVRAQEIQAIG